MSAGRKEAFDTFRRDYPHNSTIEENKATLKQRYVTEYRGGEACSAAQRGAVQRGAVQRGAGQGGVGQGRAG